MNDRKGPQTLHGERIAPPRHLGPAGAQGRQQQTPKKDEEKRKR